MCIGKCDDATVRRKSIYRGMSNAGMSIELQSRCFSVRINSCDKCC